MGLKGEGNVTKADERLEGVRGSEKREKSGVALRWTVRLPTVVTWVTSATSAFSLRQPDMTQVPQW